MSEKYPYLLFNELSNSKYKKVGLDVDYCIKVKEDCIYVFFNGSNSGLDWRINFTFPAKVYKNQIGKFLVHKGFAKAYNSAKDTIMKELLEIESYKELKVIFAGYSYGGAIAQLAAEDFHYRTSLLPTLITFGSPKILFGNKSKAHFKESCIPSQYAENNDIVTKVVPFYKDLKRINIGEKFSFIKLFNAKKYHTLYKKLSEY